MSSTLDSAQHRADTEPPAGTRSTRFGRRGVAIALVAVTVVVAVAVGLGLWLTRGAAEAPYVDPASSGRLTLCGTDGTSVTEGSTTDQPLVASVVGATAGAGGGSAALFAYQPRDGVAPTEWTGLQLTAAVPFDGTTPQLAIAKADTTLSQFLGGYPATYAGWVQLRLYVTGPDAPVGSQQYDSIDLQVDGKTWRAAGTGTATCTPTTP